MLSVNVCQMVQDAGLYGVTTTGLKCHQARCNQSVGHSSTIWDLSLPALSEPELNLGHGLRGVSAGSRKMTRSPLFPWEGSERSCSFLQRVPGDKRHPCPPGCAGPRVLGDKRHPCPPERVPARARPCWPHWDEGRFCPSLTQGRAAVP